MPALAVNIIIVHSWDVVFPRAKALGKTTPLGWTIMMSTLSAGNNCIMLDVSIFPPSRIFRLEFWFVWYYCFFWFFTSDYVYPYSNITSSFVCKGHDFMGVHYFTLHINTRHGKIIMKIMENLFIIFFSIRQLQNFAPCLQGPSWSWL